MQMSEVDVDQCTSSLNHPLGHLEIVVPIRLRLRLQDRTHPPRAPAVGDFVKLRDAVETRSSKTANP